MNAEKFADSLSGDCANEVCASADARIEVTGGRADSGWAVVCFDCQGAHDLKPQSWLQAEAFAALMTRRERACPACGGTTWVAVGDAAVALDGDRTRAFASLR